MADAGVSGVRRAVLSWRGGGAVHGRAAWTGTEHPAQGPQPAARRSGANSGRRCGARAAGFVFARRLTCCDAYRLQVLSLPMRLALAMARAGSSLGARGTIALPLMAGLASALLLVEAEHMLQAFAVREGFLLGCGYIRP